MKKFIYFEQYFVEKGSDPVLAGSICIDPEIIVGIINVYHPDLAVSDLLVIRDKYGSSNYIKGEIKNVVKRIEEALL